MIFETRIGLTFILILLFLSNIGYAANLEKLSYSKEQAATLKEMVAKLQYGHYRKLPIDDTLSAAFLDDYLEALDFSKMFFTAQDIVSFQKHRFLFDDYFKDGNLDPGYDIFEIYRDRLASRMESQLALLNDPAVTFDFTGTDEIAIDRDNSAWFETVAEADSLWLKRIKLALLDLKLSGKSTEEAKEIVARRYSQLLQNVNQQTSSDVFSTLVNSMAALFDPHTKYWPPRAAENFNINMSLSLEGIGAMLRQKEGFIEIVKLIAGGPADKQGQLKSGNRIIGVGQDDDEKIVDVVGWRLGDVVALIRGPKQTIVRLQVSAGEGSDDIKIVKIKRDRVKLEDQAAQSDTFSVSDGKRDYKIGVIDLPTFYIDFQALNNRDPNYKSSTRDIARLITELQQENIDGLIIDLRNNGGGSLLEATDLTDLFIDQGPVVQVRYYDGRINNDGYSKNRAVYRGPLMVLVNRFSASASEIFAAAIQDYKRGLIVGSQTFGKGTVQTVGKLNQGGLQLTNAKFYRVSGDSTQHRGVLPDIQLPTQVDFDEVGESSYEHALPWDQIRKLNHDQYFNFDDTILTLTSKHEARSKDDPDLKHLLAQIEMSDSNKSRKVISLNEKVRIEDARNLEERLMAIENDRRLSKNFAPYKTLDAFKNSNNDKEAGLNQTIDVENDALLIETGNLMADFISHAQATAKN